MDGKIQTTTLALLLGFTLIILYSTLINPNPLTAITPTPPTGAFLAGITEGSAYGETTTTSTSSTSTTLPPCSDYCNTLDGDAVDDYREYDGTGGCYAPATDCGGEPNVHLVVFTGDNNEYECPENTDECCCKYIGIEGCPYSPYCYTDDDCDSDLDLECVDNKCLEAAADATDCEHPCCTEIGGYCEEEPLYDLNDNMQADENCEECHICDSSEAADETPCEVASTGNQDQRCIDQGHQPSMTCWECQNPECTYPDGIGRDDETNYHCPCSWNNCLQPTDGCAHVTLVGVDGGSHVIPPGFQANVCVPDGTSACAILLGEVTTTSLPL